MIYEILFLSLWLKFNYIKTQVPAQLTKMPKIQGFKPRFLHLCVWEFPTVIVISSI